MLPSTTPLGPKDQTIFGELHVAIPSGEEQPYEPPRVSNGSHKTKPKKNQVAERHYQQVRDHGENIHAFWNSVS